MVTKYSFERIRRGICLRIATYIPMSNQLRVKFSKMGGVKIEDPHNSFIGESVIFDSLYPENIILHKHVHITMRCVILTHYLDTSCDGVHYKKGKVELCDNCFIGANTLICNSVRIGRNSIVGAGSVVTKDIPDYSIAVGNPCKVIKIFDFEKGDWVKV